MQEFCGKKEVTDIKKKQEDENKGELWHFHTWDITKYLCCIHIKNNHFSF